MQQLEALYHQHGPDLLAYLRHRFAADEADELLQETFTQAARNLERLTGADSPRAWLFGIARNVGLSARRKRRSVRPLDDEPAARLSTATDPRIERMREAIAKLGDIHREVIELRLGRDLSYEEIAAALRVPVGTVRSRLHHAMRQLRAALLCEQARERQDP
jgi:RNA polymerase sigma-70 factor (ECF subfamily)